MRNWLKQKMMKSYNCYKFSKKVFQIIRKVIFYLKNNNKKIMSITSSSSNRNTQKFRIVFLGDQGVGKTSIIERYTNNKFEQGYHATVGIDFNVKDVNKNGQYYRLQMWDTAGQQRYRSLIPTYLKNAHCVVFVYDVTKPTTLENIAGWHKMFIENQQAPGFLIANKTDLSNARKVTRSDAQALSKKLGLQYQQVSAKTGKKINQLFYSVLDRIIKHKTEQVQIQDPNTSRERFQKKVEEKQQKNVKLNKKQQGWFQRTCCSQ